MSFDEEDLDGIMSDNPPAYNSSSSSNTGVVTTSNNPGQILINNLINSPYITNNPRQLNYATALRIQFPINQEVTPIDTKGIKSELTLVNPNNQQVTHESNLIPWNQLQEKQAGEIVQIAPGEAATVMVPSTPTNPGNKLVNLVNKIENVANKAIVLGQNAKVYIERAKPVLKLAKMGIKVYSSFATGNIAPAIKEIVQIPNYLLNDVAGSGQLTSQSVQKYLLKSNGIEKVDDNYIYSASAMDTDDDELDDQDQVYTILPIDVFRL